MKNPEEFHLQLWWPPSNNEVKAKKEAKLLQ